LRLSNVQTLLVSEQQNLSSTDGWSPQSLKFSFPKTVGTEDLPPGVRTELLQSLDFSGVFMQSVMQQTQKDFKLSWWSMVFYSKF